MDLFGDSVFDKTEYGQAFDLQILQLHKQEKRKDPMIISILGCGWLGFPLAQRLVTEKYHVKGSARSEKKVTLLNQNSITGYRIHLPDSFQDEGISDFWNSDILFLNIPPSRGGGPDTYPELIRTAAHRFLDGANSDSKWILFASSTSVYSDTGGFTTEADVTTETTAKRRGQTMLAAEKAVQSLHKNTTILRLGGLYGYGRHPVHHLSGRKDLSDPQKPVHLIHQKDCLNIITKLIQKNLKGETFNLVSDGHPPRKAFYQNAAKYNNLPLPDFLDEPEKEYRIISNKKIKDQLRYSFTYPNPMDHTP